MGVVYHETVIAIQRSNAGLQVKTLDATLPISDVIIVKKRVVQRPRPDGGGPGQFQPGSELSYANFSYGKR